MIDLHISEAAYVLIACALLLSGFVKGSIGFGLPLIAVPLISIFLPVKTAVAVLTVPVLVSSIQMALSGGHIFARARNYAVLLGGLLLGVVIGVVVLVNVSEQVLYVILGGVTIMFTLSGWIKSLSAFLQRRDVVVEGIIGLIAGTVGGVSSAFGPLIAAYLNANNVPKLELVQVLNIFLVAASALMIVVYGLTTSYNIGYFGASLMACLPVMLGVWYGEFFRKKISENKFRSILQFVLIALSLNLFRRAFM
jgi:uncharacterized membrane protein YfcA